MTIWFFLWLLLSLVLLFFLGWNLLITFKQKKAWQAFAADRGLRYKSDAFMRSPRLDGVVNGYTIGMFAAEHVRDSSRTSRKLTAIEIQLSSEMPFDGAVASAGMIELVKAMDFKEEITPNSTHWDKKHVAITSYKAAMQAYLTDERVKALVGLMRMKNAWVILAFRNGVFLLRVDTPNALAESKVIDDVLAAMIKVAAVMELNDGEAAILKRARIVESAKVPVLDDKVDFGGLQLEDDAE